MSEPAINIPGIVVCDDCKALVPEDSVYSHENWHDRMRDHIENVREYLSERLNDLSEMGR